jgi:hypothetical protein
VADWPEALPFVDAELSSIDGRSPSRADRSSRARIMRPNPAPTSHPTIRALIAAALLLPIAGLPLAYPERPTAAVRG